MTGVFAAIWGLFGGFCAEGLGFYIAVRHKVTWPWRARGGPSLLVYASAELVRLIIGAGLAWAFAASGQIATPVAALAVGVAAPLLVERLSQAGPLTVGESAAPRLARPARRPGETNPGRAGSTSSGTANP
ncbi:hypothetical protein [Pseudofrankia asymbiotica]|nr:hypothetical protein [Pseudofrankia asymbiotica]